MCGDVAAGLRSGLAEGRRQIAKIVGRDPDTLDEPAVARAAIESLAENLSDGVVAPLLFAAIGGLPAALAYKAVNTLDSMVGHKSERYRHFGWASARADDLLNLVPARVTGLALVGWRRARRRRLAGRMAGAAARREAPPLSQRRLARGRDGGRSGPQARGAADLWRPARRGRLDGRRPHRGRSRRHRPRPRPRAPRLLAARCSCCSDSWGSRLRA